MAKIPEHRAKVEAQDGSKINRSPDSRPWAVEAGAKATGPATGTKMKKTTVLIGLLTLAAGFWLWHTFAGGGSEGEIRRQLRRLEDLIEKERGEGALTAVARAAELEGFFTRAFSVELAPYGEQVGDLRNLQRVFVATRQGAETIAVDFQDVTIEVEGNRAAMSLVAYFNGLAGALGAREAFAADFEWREEDGAWKIQRVKVVDLDQAR
jgi:hypothetical protein